MANKTQFSGARASLERWLKRLVQSTSMLLMLAVGTLVHAETRTEVGVAGAHGVDAQATASVAGDGEGGEGATVDLSSPPLGNEALYDSTAIGGRGGNGGRGHTRADGGHGGPGGAASARSAINRDSGPATARASAIGGDGGHFGNGGTSGTGGPGGSATASGVASTASADAIVVEVTARGGRSGDTSTGIPVEGGTATITEARAESNGGDVEVDATAISGRGGSGFPNSNGLFVGPGGRSPDVVLRNVVDGMTSGTIVLRQTAVSGDGGGGFSQPALGISAPDSGDTVSFVERMRSATSLSIEATAQSGAGGQGTYASTGGRGGNADAHASAD
ncbi:MAG: hypothetical protein KDK91_29495, partial [Gammaproteobacteria bacterium]|nr:hypothetical protein [Gammaproteobacteria bacterium]